ncbi:pilus assembly protein PilP [Curvibacter delicatus]|jgi:type IV pilus assembly protein PilP|uniref:pilus assembly protein PilP n=1 Tax=Curvibacter delicatus TaxID=80879 RepID=UPI0008375054|nr:pilus assembly protein PilP [Curvibacter delicatus]
MKTLGYGFLVAASVLVLTGCGASSEDELRQWMAEQRSQTRPRVTPIPEPKQFKPEPYAQAGAVEPFSKEKLAQALKRESSQSAVSSALIAPELARRKEPLEAFPLDSMTMVGSLLKEGKPVALVKVDNLLYQVRPGNYLGQNYGRITKITETQVTLREIAQDAVGEWVERPATLQLQERLK